MIDSALRDYLPSDFDALCRLDRICFEPGIAYPPGEMCAFLRLPGARAVVAESGGEIAGFALAAPVRGGAVHVITLDVHPGHRRRGLGRALLQGVLERTCGRAAREILLEVDTGNREAIGFYRALGFRTQRRLPDYYAPGRDAWEMSRPS